MLTVWAIGWWILLIVNEVVAAVQGIHDEANADDGWALLGKFILTPQCSKRKTV